jgi:hypothetical protein
MVFILMNFNMEEKVTYLLHIFIFIISFSLLDKQLTTICWSD